MCELFAMSSRYPANVSSSLEEFARHGGLTGPHKDGWGVAMYEALDVQVVREPAPAASSECLRFMRERHLESPIVIAHVRRATQGEPALRNTQPFTRELGGRIHVFAHNGDLGSIRDARELRAWTFRPVGDTDSEYAFCALLESMRELWLGSVPPSIEDRVDVVTRFANAVRRLGPANFLYSDGELVFMHGHRRKHGPHEGPRWPGLHVLCRSCAGQSETPQEVVLAASVPLTAEAWRPLDEGEIVVARAGKLLGRAADAPVAVA
jgi:predicted glutamine amidotransferase